MSDGGRQRWVSCEPAAVGAGWPTECEFEESGRRSTGWSAARCFCSQLFSMRCGVSCTVHSRSVDSSLADHASVGDRLRAWVLYEPCPDADQTRRTSSITDERVHSARAAVCMYSWHLWLLNSSGEQVHQSLWLVWDCFPAADVTCRNYSLRTC